MKHDRERTNKSDMEYTVTQPGGLLEFLLLSLTKKSRNNIKSILTHREVMVDGRIITKYDYQLKPGQIIKIGRSMDRDQAQLVKLNILFEDDDFIAINKPAGLLTIATDKERDLTAYKFMTDHIQRFDPMGRIFAVHRLDRETSGVLMVAKNERLKKALQDNWDQLVTHRGYTAIVEGVPSNKSGKIRSWLLETKTLLMYSSDTPGDGQEAITNYQVIKENTDYAMLSITLETGRKNQIRVHMKELGHPVAGDKKYGAKTDPIKRLCLHAGKLEFKHPFTDKIMCFKADLPGEFGNLLK